LSFRAIRIPEPLPTTALRVGLRDEFEFCRTFKREFGVATPAARKPLYRAPVIERP